MRPIQIVLALASLVTFVLYLARFRSPLRDRLMFLGFLLVVLLAILLPDKTTVLARAIGVGRGADLVLYLLAAGGAFAFVLMYSRLASLERRQTEIIRHLAIREAKRPEAR